jgi:ADP-ribose pyrophosphatase YjhB (NUDIX family)
MFNYCPSCASKKICFNVNVFRCPDCGFTYYHNTAAATGCVISVPDAGGEKIVFLVRGKEPSAGKLDLPGGFIDPGEGALEGLYRELREELGWTPQIPQGESLSNIFKLFASFPNVYPYKGFDYNTCDLYFYVNASGLKPEDLNMERAEVSEVQFLRHQEIDFDTLAFESTKRAIKAYIELKN